MLASGSECFGFESLLAYQDSLKKIIFMDFSRKFFFMSLTVFEASFLPSPISLKK